MAAPRLVTRTLITPPPACWSLAALKDHLKIQVFDEDGLLVDYERAAVSQIEEDAGLKLRTQTWDLEFDGFPYSGWDLGRHQFVPLQSVTTITYTGADGETLPVAASAYRVTDTAIRLTATGSWPTAGATDASVLIRVVTGFVVDRVPEDLRHLVRMVVGVHHQHRALAAVERETYDTTIARYQTTVVA